VLLTPQLTQPQSSIKLSRAKAARGCTSYGIFTVILQ